jgi:hypothetical protein
VAKSKSELFTLIGANLPDNTTGQITPAKLREVTTQLADSAVNAVDGAMEVEVLRAASTVTQAPTALDTPLQLTYGTAQGSASDPVMVNAAGLVTFNVAGNYAVRLKLQAGRTGASGTSILFARLLKNGAQYGVPACAKMVSAEDTFPVESRVVINAAAGDTFAAQIMRDSGGTNYGGVYAVTPTTLTTWGASPSALLVISRLEAV